MEQKADLINLPEKMIIAALQHAVSGGMRRVLAGEPAQRMALMMLALPVIEEAKQQGTIFSVACPVEPDLDRRFREYCADMNLNMLPLLVGAIMVELGLASMPSELPDFDHTCVSDSAI